METHTPNIHATERVLLKPYSAKEIAGIYGVGKKTLKKWIAPFDTEIGEKKGRFYTVAQVKVIFSKLGLPDVVQA